MQAVEAAFNALLSDKRVVPLTDGWIDGSAPIPPKWAKLKLGVSLTLDKSWGQRHMHHPGSIFPRYSGLCPEPGAVQSMPSPEPIKRQMALFCR